MDKNKYLYAIFFFVILMVLSVLSGCDNGYNIAQKQREENCKKLDAKYGKQYRVLRGFYRNQVGFALEADATGVKLKLSDDLKIGVLCADIEEVE